LGTVSVDFDITGKLLIRYSAFVTQMEKEWEYNATVHILFRDIKKTYNSVKGEVKIKVKLSL
jgi:hypothetical protein